MLYGYIHMKAILQRVHKLLFRVMNEKNIFL